MHRVSDVQRREGSGQARAVVDAEAVDAQVAQHRRGRGRHWQNEARGRVPAFNKARERREPRHRVHKFVERRCTEWHRKCQTERFETRAP